MLDQSLEIALAVFAIETTGSSMILVVGDSMRPLLRAGMYAEVERVHEKPRIGDVLVFRTPRGLIVHRLVSRINDSIYLTCGDACPESPERVTDVDIIGRVKALWSSAGPGARRLDGIGTKIWGQCISRTRGSRAFFRACTRGLRSILRRDEIVPAFRLMFAASIAFERGELGLGLQHTLALPFESLISIALRHRMGGLFYRWLSEAVLAGYEVPVTLLRRFEISRWSAAISATQIAMRANDVSIVLANAGIDAIILKGSARLLAGERDADLDDAADVDVLVRSDCAEDAVRALRTAGYKERVSERAIQFYKKFVHHRAELWPADGFVPVEIHAALSSPRSRSAKLDYETLICHTRKIEAKGGPVQIFDDVAFALHLAYHARDFHRLRDVILLSRYLRRMSVEDRLAFDRLAMREGRDSVRLQSGIVAAECLYTPKTLSRRVAAYLSWVIVREDLPASLRKRAGLVEALKSHCYLNYKGLFYASRTAHRWALNTAATPIIRDWLAWSNRVNGEGSELLGRVN